MKTITHTISESRCNHNNGRYFTLQCLIFKKRFYVCYDCHMIFGLKKLNSGKEDYNLVV